MSDAVAHAVGKQSVCPVRSDRDSVCCVYVCVCVCDWDWLGDCAGVIIHLEDCSTEYNSDHTVTIQQQEDFHHVAALYGSNSTIDHTD